MKPGRQLSLYFSPPLPVSRKDEISLQDAMSPASRQINRGRLAAPRGAVPCSPALARTAGQAKVQVLTAESLPAFLKGLWHAARQWLLSIA